jgi:hypothetical protein
VIPDEELDRLYALPLEEFTRARDGLARELRKEGEREAADEVKALAKPSLPAWTVNQLAREEPMQMRGLTTAGERLRKAQAELLEGGGPDELQAALQRQRDVVGALVGSAKRILEAAGQAATEATLERVRGTLTAAAAHQEGARLVERGRLTKELEPAGFGGMAAAPGGKRRRAQPKRAADEARKRRLEAAKRKVVALRAEAAEQRDRAGRAASEARKAEAELERVTARLEAAEAALSQETRRAR